MEFVRIVVSLNYASHQVVNFIPFTSQLPICHVYLMILDFTTCVVPTCELRLSIGLDDVVNWEATTREHDASQFPR